MQLRGCPSARLGARLGGQPQASSRRSVACSFFGNKRAGPNNNFSRQQYEQAIGNLLQTVSSPAPPSTESVPPSGATAQPVVHDDQNGQGLHVVKPEKPVDTTDAQLESQAVEDSHAAEASTSQTEAAAALKAAIEKEAAVQLALKAELAASAAKAALQEQLQAAAAAAAAAASSDDSQASAPPSAEELVKADTATGKLQQQLHQNKDTMAADQQQNKEAAAQEGRVLKPAAARTEPKTPGAKGRKVPQAANPRNLVFVTAEVAPWSKTGGLGDVLGSLPIALAARGHRVMVVVPRYANYAEPLDTGKRVDIMGAEVGYFHHFHKGVDWVFVDHPSYPRPGGLYADEHGVYGDNQFRFMLLALAALEAPLQLPLGDKGLYGEDCVFMANDWHASMVPVYLAAKYRAHGVFKNARSVMAIHNLRHQGVFPPTTYPSLGLPSGWYHALEYQYPPHMRQGSYAEEGRSVNMLKGGLCTADRVVTVSPGYAGEIRTWLGGWGLEGLLNERGYVLNGIVNGIDDEDWNPAVDKHLPKNYNITNFKEGKRACKMALQEELGLPVNADMPLIAFIGRLDYQKGADIVLQAAPWLMSQGVQLVCLGTGSTDLENGLRWLEAAYKDQARGWVGFNVAISHRITAAADILLMPSRFEPCGLNQLYAMQYGTVPVAHKTGGLSDTVIDFNPEQQAGTGWTFSNCDVSGLMHATGLALQTLREYPKDFEGIQLRGMQRDSTWNGAAEQYEQIFEWALLDQPYA